MKKFLNLLFFTSLILFSNCKSDPCESTVCKNGGNCNDGTCECAFGYEGNNCETEKRQKFIGKYKGVFTVDGSNFNSTIEIKSVNNNVVKMEISEDGTKFCDVELIDSKKFNVPVQVILLDGDTYTVTSGNGSLSDPQLLFNFTLTESGSSITLSFQGTKQ